MSIEYDTTTISTAIQQSSQGQLVLPEFQRGFDWSHAQQQSLLASILAHLPIGGLLVLEGPRNALASRSFVTQQAAPPRQDVTYLLDGQQRLTCTSAFFSDVYMPYPSWENHQREIPTSLNYRWFLRIDPSRVDSEDYFGVQQLYFSQQAAEPETMSDLLHWEKVNRTEKAPKPWHPKWWAHKSLTDSLQIQAARHQAAEAFAADGLVPLWELCGYGDGTPLHEISIRLIASRVGEQFISMGDEIPPAVLTRLFERRPDLSGRLRSADDSEWTAALREMASDWRADVVKYLERTVEQKIARIVLPVDEIGRSVSIFETTNRGGTPLSTYDLVVARMARNDEPSISLTRLIIDHAVQANIIIDEYTDGTFKDETQARVAVEDTDFVTSEGELTARFKNMFLQVLAVRDHMLTHGPDELSVTQTKKASILELDSRAINDGWRPATQAVIDARAFLMTRCGVRRSDDLRNQLILLPLALILDASERSPQIYDRLEYWYWCSVLGGRYREQQNAQCIEDLILLYRWLVDGDTNPFRSDEARALHSPEYSDEAALLQRDQDSRIAADVGAYLAQYVMSLTPLDFLEHDEPVRAWDIGKDLQLHHVVPLGSAATLQESAKALRSDKDHLLNSPLNLTYILAATNLKLRSLPASTYMSEVSDAVRASHFLPVEEAAYQTVGDETDEQCWERVLSDRHKSLRMQVSQELTRLRS